jgi:hypothetical protein
VFCIINLLDLYALPSICGFLQLFYYWVKEEVNEKGKETTDKRQWIEYFLDNPRSHRARGYWHPAE